jgi:hypothetical protein
MPAQEASIKEGETLQKYLDNGWKKLNLNGAGNLGGNGSGYLFKSKKDMVKSVKSCNDIKEFKSKFSDSWAEVKKLKLSNSINYFYLKKENGHKL